ncbi:hypothetical protein AGMMS49579_15170 [Spirochaetia bacterium]|nr:hypothetical protein AGMMS49579_15170 [Spirochaetia bacterium]
MESLKIKCFRYVDATNMDFILRNFSSTEWIAFIRINVKLKRIDMKFIRKWQSQIRMAFKERYKEYTNLYFVIFNYKIINIYLGKLNCGNSFIYSVVCLTTGP